MTMESLSNAELLKRYAEVVEENAQLKAQAMVSCSPLSCSVGYSQYFLQSTTTSTKSRKTVVTWDEILQALRIKTVNVSEILSFKISSHEDYYNWTHEVQEEFAEAVVLTGWHEKLFEVIGKVS